jgi:hypothetical protein
VLNTYGPLDGDAAERGDGGSVVLVNSDLEESYVDFKVGEYPHLPRLAGIRGAPAPSDGCLLLVCACALCSLVLLVRNCESHTLITNRRWFIPSIARRI